MGFADLVFVFYTLGSLGGILGLFARWSTLRKPAAYCIGAGFALQTLVVVSMFFFSDINDFNRGQLLQIMAWSLVFVYCVAWWRLRVSFLGITAGPLALLLSFSAAGTANVAANLPEAMTGAFFVLHLGVLFLNFALISLGFGSALFFLSLHTKLKSKKALPEITGGAPALVTVERINNFVVLAGFPLFTIGLLTGFAWAYLARGAVFTADPKEVASMLLWLFYAFIFLQRAVFGWQGRKGAVMLIALFAATVCSALGVNLFMDSHHNFFQTPMF